MTTWIGIRLIRPIAALALVFFSCALCAEYVDAQPIWGPTTITTTPSQLDAGNAFQINVSSQLVIGCSPLLVDSVTAQVIGSTIEVTAFISCGVFTTPNQYALSAVIGPLNAGNYTIQHYRRLRSFGSGLPYSSPELAGALSVSVSSAGASPIPALSNMNLGALALARLIAGMLVRSRRRNADRVLAVLLAGVLIAPTLWRYRPALARRFPVDSSVLTQRCLLTRRRWPSLWGVLHILRSQ